MRPLSLSIKGFGPYVKAEISETDFSLLNSSGLFLICGEIGAGKTTLFDAIVYALYGKSSIEDRPPKEMVSHLLPKLKLSYYPEISFKFAFNNKIFEIKRRLPYNNLTTERVSLWINGKIYSSKKEEIKKYIKELFRLDANQFKKVFLIPQGEYRKILIEKGKEKRELFENIFETFFYADLEEFLKEKRNELEKELKILKEKILYIEKSFDGVSLEETEKIYQDLEKKENLLKKEIDELYFKKRNLEQEILKLEKSLEVFSNIKKLEERLTELKKEEKKYLEKKEFIKKLEKFQEKFNFYTILKKTWKELRDLSSKRRNLRILLNSNKEALEKLKNEAKELSKKEPEIETLKQKLKELEKRKEIISNFKAKKREKEKLENECKELEDRQKNLKNKKEKLIKKIKIYENLSELFTNLRKLFENKKIIEEKLSYFEEKKKKKEVISKLDEEIEKLKKEVETLQREKEKYFLLCEAEKLANLLKPGEPCPLCGSKEHPHPISPSQNFHHLKRTEKELKNKEEILKAKEKKLNMLKGELQIIEQKIKNEEEKEVKMALSQIEKNISSVLNDLKVYPNFSNYVPYYEDVLTKEEEFHKKFKTAFDLLNETEKTLEEVEALLSDKKSQLNELEGALKELENFCEGSLEEPEKEIKEIFQIIKDFEHKKSTLEEQIKNLEIDIEAKNAKLNQIQEQIKTQLKDYKKAFSEVFSLVKEKIFSSLKELKEANKYLKDLPKLRDEVAHFYNEVERIEKNLGDLKKEREKTPFISISEIEKEIKDKKEKLYDIEEKSRKLNEEIGRITQKKEEILNKQKELKNLYKEFKEKEKHFGLIEHLYTVITGKNELRTSFYSYVLSTFINFALKRANRYFYEFSFGRYRFITEEIFKKDFNLKVFDNYTGKEREVRTLSGGESFIATLSFALGISDVILEIYKAKPFESLFIDEGFATLDIFTLEKVVEVLINFGQKSGRTIGIISHIEELKRKFPVILEVKKNPQKGSQIKIIKNF